jgi:hypothetical protein
MKVLRSFLVPLALALASGAFAAPLLPFEAGAPAATHPSMYSFSDVYRLTVAGEPFGGFRFADSQAQLRVVSRAAALNPLEAGPELRFSVSAPNDSGRWTLLLAGLFACAWVAHRRLASPY